MLWLSKDWKRSREVWLAFLAFLVLVSLCILEARPPRASAAATSALASEPSLSLPDGYYDRDVQVEIDPPYPGADVLFTLDGATPTRRTGTVYKQPIRLSAAAPAVTVIRARAVLPGGGLGPVVSASYLVGVQATLPMVSLIVDPGDLWDAERGLFANPFQRGMAWERPVEVTYVDRDRRSGFHVPAGLRVHGRFTRSYDKRSFRLYFRNEYGMNRLEYPLFPQGDVQSFKRLVLHNGGQDFAQSRESWTLLRNQLAAGLALQLGGCAARSRPALVFLNGQPWGIYQIRERIDRWFLADHYGIESADLLDTLTVNGAEGIVEGDPGHWDSLLEYVAARDLSDPVHYAYVRSQVDLGNLIDYTVLQIYSANVDWLHTNVNQFRPRVPGGRWRWFFWDSDYGFGLVLRSRVSSNLIGDTLNPTHPRASKAYTVLLRKLLENPVFRARFLGRTADLLNTVLSPASVTAQVDALAAEMAPDIIHETGRWLSRADWEANVRMLRDFAEARTEVVRQHYVEAFGLRGTAAFTLNRPAAGDGSVAVNDVLRSQLPWEGVYFQGTDVRVMAVPASGYRFAGWEEGDLEQAAAITVTVGESRTLTPRFERVEEGVYRPGDVVFTGRHVDDEEFGGDWFELLVMRREGVDLRGWRVTDNDTKTATDEGSLVFTGHPAFADVPYGTRIRVIATESVENDARFSEDDLEVWDRLLVLYVGNGQLDGDVDPWFDLGVGDNLVLLAPGRGSGFEDDQGIASLPDNGAVELVSPGQWIDGTVAKPLDTIAGP